MINMDKFFECAMGAATDFAGGKDKGVGIAFRNENGKHSATVASSHYVADIVNIPEPKSNFFSFFYNAYTSEYEFPVPLNELLGVVYSVKSNPIGAAVTKNGNLNQHLGFINNMLGIGQNGRYVIHRPSTLSADERIMRFKDVDGKKIFIHEKFEKPFIAVDQFETTNQFGEKIVKRSAIQPIDIKGGFYRCIVIGEDESACYVSAVDIYGSLIMDLLYTKYVYDAENPPEAKPEFAFGFPVFVGDIEKFNDTHIDAYSLFTVMKLFQILPDGVDVKIEFYEDQFHPLQIFATDGETEITLKLAVLDSSKHRRYEWR